MDAFEGVAHPLAVFRREDVLDDDVALLVELLQLFRAQRAGLDAQFPEGLLGVHVVLPCSGAYSRLINV